MADSNLPEWITAVSAALLTALTWVGIRQQQNAIAPVLEATTTWRDDGLLEFRLAASRPDKGSLVISGIRLKAPRHARLGLSEPEGKQRYAGIPDSSAFIRPFGAKMLTVNWPIGSINRSAGYTEFYSAVFVELNRSSRSTSITIEFLVWTKSRPKRKRWIPVTSSISEQTAIQKLAKPKGS